MMLKFTHIYKNNQVFVKWIKDLIKLMEHKVLVQLILNLI